MMEINDLIDIARIKTVDDRLTGYFIDPSHGITSNHRKIVVPLPSANRIFKDFNEFLEDYTGAEKTYYMIESKLSFIRRIGSLTYIIERNLPDEDIE